MHTKSVQSTRHNFYGAVFTNENVVKYFCGLHERESHQKLLLECKSWGDLSAGLLMGQFNEE